MIFRYARHTNNLVALKDFYTQVLNLEVLGSFENHDQYNGVFLGKQNQDWHLEFTQSNETAQSIFDDDDILIFYLESLDKFNKIVDNLELFNVPILEAKNPYWKENGIYFRDPDGYNIIISKQKL